MKVIQQVIGQFSLIIFGVFAIASSATADQVILDDLIVDGSACIGFDCVNGESFGFDTIRIKENNLRIRAQDTSSTASFPTNDWQLTFNDSANGGANKFSVDDIDGGRTPFTIEAGAPSHSLYVDDGGKVGFGTSIPVVDLHVKSGNTPTLRLEQDGSSGFTPQTWDVAGNEANFFIRDATNGSTLPFRIFPGAPSNALSIEASTGDIGIGTTSPVNTIHISRANGNAGIELEATGSTPQSYIMRTHNATGEFQFRDDTANNIPFRIGSGAGANLLNVGVNAAGNANEPGVINVAGSIVASGTITPDYVFETAYKLESIEDHASFMWSNKHLPGVEAAIDDGLGRGLHRVDLVKRAQSLLEELEKAHIYIEQLSKEIKQIKTGRDEVYSTFEERLSRLESK